MAFSAAAGHGNLPNGAFSPVIYSKQVQLAFRKSSVCEEITNSDYFGEIANMGDSVKVIKEPEITVKAYSRGTTITPQDLDDEEFSLTIDKANYFAFKVDDIEEAHSHINFQELASNRAAYRLADQFDQDVLGYMSGYKQSAIHSSADTANTTTNGTVAVSTAGTDELLSSMKIDAAAAAPVLKAYAQTSLSLAGVPNYLTKTRRMFVNVSAAGTFEVDNIPKPAGAKLS